MDLLRTARSHWANIALFKPFFPARRMLADALRTPLNLLGNGRAGPYPLVVDINVTNRCNMSCSFCYNANNNTPATDELTLAEFGELAREAAAHRAGFFISGGEPLVRPDLPDIVATLKSRNAPVGLVTNGTLLDQSQARAWANSGLDVAVVSLHGLEEGHDAALNSPGSFDKAWRALDILRTTLPPPGPMANIVVGEHSLTDLPALLSRVRQRDNIVPRIAHLSFIRPDERQRHQDVWNATFGPGEYRLLNPELDLKQEVLAKLVQMLSTSPCRSVTARPSLSLPELNQWYTRLFALRRRCLFAWHSTVINADGEVFPCQYHAWSMGNIRKEPLARIWNNERYRHFRRVLRKGLLPGCARCCKL